MIGEVVGNYEILKCIGKGGMGAVYLARHKLIGRRAAIKVLLPATSGDEEMVQRFFNEARSTSEVKHPGLIDVFDFGHHNGSAYIAMEFLEGESLAARLKREHASTELIVGVGRQVASALSAAHAHGIVHRDLKPDNVFLVPDEETAIGVRAKVLDFGIAKLSGENAGMLKTSTNSLMGTPAYMSPEQCQGAKAVDARSDIYSLGCILFEMTTGRIPFAVAGLGEMIVAHMTEAPPHPRELNPDAPEWLDYLILRAMAKKVEERYQTMDELASILGGHARSLGQIAPPSVVATGTPSPKELRAAVDANSFGGQATMPPSARPATGTGRGADLHSFGTQATVTPPKGVPSVPRGVDLDALGRQATITPATGIPSVRTSGAEQVLSSQVVASPTNSQVAQLPTPTIDGDVPRKSGSKGWIAAVAGAVVVVGVAGFLAVSHSSKKPSAATAPNNPPAGSAEAPAPPKQPDPVAVGSAAVASPVAPPDAAPAVPPPPTEVHWTVTSKPPGAEVFVAATGAKLGVTPLDLKRPLGTGSVPVIVKAPRRAPANLDLSLEHDTTLDVVLEKPSGSTKHGSGTTQTPTGPTPTSSDGTIDPFKTK